MDRDYSDQVRIMLESDFSLNMREMIRLRRLYRHITKISEVTGNLLLYAGIFLSTLSAAVTLVVDNDNNRTERALLYASSVCIGAHTALIGIARCASRENDEHEELLQKLSETIGVDIVTLPAEVVDDKTSLHNN